MMNGCVYAAGSGIEALWAFGHVHVCFHSEAQTGAADITKKHKRNESTVFTF